MKVERRVRRDRATIVMTINHNCKSIMMACKSSVMAATLTSEPPMILLENKESIDDASIDADDDVNNSCEIKAIHSHIRGVESLDWTAVLLVDLTSAIVYKVPKEW